MKKFYFMLVAMLGTGIFYSQTYCTPAFGNDCSGGDQIDSFEIPNASFSHLDTGCSAGQYGDYTSMTITLQAGVIIPYSITQDYEAQNVKIWIDLNNDGDFIDDAPELISTASSTGTGSSTITDGVISIPSNAVPGNYRIRVATRFSSQPTPCNTGGWGEAHDYTAVVTAAPSCAAPSGLTINSSSAFTAELTWTPPTTAPANGYEIYYSTTNTPPSASPTPAPVPASSSTHTLNDLASSTDYYYWVRSLCSATETSAWSMMGTFSTTDFCPVVVSPYDLAEAVSLTPTFTWETMVGATSYILTIGTTSGGTDILNNVNVGNVTSHTLATTLSYDTTYYYTVNATNGTAVSSNCYEYEFKTRCAATTPSYTNDFSNFPGACWSRAWGGTPATGPNEDGTADAYNWREMTFLGPATTGGGATALNLYYEDRAGWLISPVFDFSTGNYILSFDYGITAYNSADPETMGSDDVVNVLMSTDGGATWTIVQTWTVADNIDNTSHAYSYTIPATTSNQVVFAIYGADNTQDTGSDYDFHVDNFAITSFLSTNDVVKDKDMFSVYPNPFTDIINISNIKDVKEVEVFDMSGRLVKKIDDLGRDINLATLSKGVYIIKIYTKQGSQNSVRVIKK